MTDRTNDEARQLALAAAAATERTENAVLLDVQGISSYTDFILIVSGDSDRQVEAIADRVAGELKKQGHRPIGTEGEGSGGWVLVDFGDVVVHVFKQSMREFYDLESLWIEAPRVDLDPKPDADRSDDETG